VVSDLATTRAEFAVEFDGASHDTPDARRRDATKNEVCDRLGLPILRVVLPEIPVTHADAHAEVTDLATLIAECAALRCERIGEAGRDLPGSLVRPVLYAQLEARAAARDATGAATVLGALAPLLGTLPEDGPAVRAEYRGIRSRPAGTVGFKPLPMVWRVENAFAQLGRWRRLSRCYEGTAESAKAWLEVACVGYMLGRV
jgi:hypothetical protein